jgi:hypothetical protein
VRKEFGKLAQRRAIICTSAYSPCEGQVGWSKGPPIDARARAEGGSGKEVCCRLAMAGPPFSWNETTEQSAAQLGDRIRVVKSGHIHTRAIVSDCLCQITATAGTRPTENGQNATYFLPWRAAVLEPSPTPPAIAIYDDRDTLSRVQRRSAP